VKARLRFALGLLATLVLGGAVAALRGHGAAEAAPAPTWPNEGARLAPPPVVFPPDFGVKRVVVDAGHGAEENRGNTSCTCVAEQDFTLAVADRIGARLEATGHFEVRETRVGSERVAYADRVDDAEAFAADAFVSIHSDVRGHAVRWWPTPAESCPIAAGATGFSVLYADEGEGGLVARRLDLARALALRLASTGFAAYASGYDLYDADATPGVFVDRHAPAQRIFVLRRPSMPSVILETHNALEPRDAERWSELETFDAAADALAGALVDALR
jgi:N-acetylmuramoyl-L-alanine amidase